ncbi:uncharacterized protein G2W53_040150 [Senna tora]|uniref:Uncharacterized protein n=1 Tax=Senna tora TaxID=362788 RepID=A0A834T2D6_9FABA|nr:uncharacterized protein G2W53_040150 [Senna tora]
MNPTNSWVLACTTSSGPSDELGDADEEEGPAARITNDGGLELMALSRRPFLCHVSEVTTWNNAVTDEVEPTH